ncbi:zinc finger BED domain-containing protein RICESLEEPER 1-like [Sesamum indicum]|uniref:Zinc finger BED domain-containing protein RICESLEEPER 1-like n=1 Tax=Sesamum indicum TaxID=4182 RepID=A0A6I9SN79_SESIN|nr:zinc finger BED domain-containing protein RICESLEEPER 1-like [Sesamum indicum]
MFPWSFEKNVLVLSGIDVNENLMHVDLGWSDFYVDVHDLPLTKINLGIAAFIRNKIGKFRDLEMELLWIFTITVDNASSNDGAMVYLKKKLENWGQNILGGKYVHMRCIAHIINLVVQDGLKGKDEHEAISRIRGAVRWNSTYLMLEAAICLKRAFDAYEDIDVAYRTDLSKKPFDGVPIESDWDRAKMLLKLLNSDDVELSDITRKMKEKFYMYWGSIEKMNTVLYYGVILDPRHKLGFIEFSFDKLYGGIGQSDVLKERVRDGLHELFNDYKLRYGHALQGTLESPGSSSSRFSSSSSSSKKMFMHDEDNETRRFSLQQEYMMYMTGGKDHVKSELEKYLSEDVEEYREKFDILKVSQ